MSAAFIGLGMVSQMQDVKVRFMIASAISPSYVTIIAIMKLYGTGGSLNKCNWMKKCVWKTAQALIIQCVKSRQKPGASNKKTFLLILKQSTATI